MIRTDDFRIAYVEEARDCIRANHFLMKKHPEDWNTFPEFWANLLGAVANSNIGAVDDDLAWHLMDIWDQREKKKADIKAMLDKKLGKP